MYVRDFSDNRGNVESGAGQRFGIELEVENGSIPDAFSSQNFWTYIEDGSLRNSGLEFVSRPLASDELDVALRLFYGWMGRMDYTGSVRTSTHVHVNVLDHTMEELGAVLAAYSIVEPLLFKVCGSEREECIYCVPWYRADEQVGLAAQAINQQRSRYFGNACKYSSLYLEPLVRFGTLEFRHAPLFREQREIRLWIDLIRRIAYDSIATWGTAEAVLQAYDNGCDAFLNELFGEQLLQDLAVYCQGDFERIIDDADSITVAEDLVPSLCTYKVTDKDWTVPVPAVEGDGTEGYRNVAFRGRAPAYSLDEMNYDEYPEDMDEYYGDEEEY